ncbi:MAG: hypothetical protein J5695_05800 [Bacteroidales bacterium]|nr:hypothetical protein [Bacteroidales bacterium]MBO4566721.1 hypothetical protein [Bacteroidales bacterium]
MEKDLKEKLADVAATELSEDELDQAAGGTGPYGYNPNPVVVPKPPKVTPPGGQSGPFVPPPTTNH